MTPSIHRNSAGKYVVAVYDVEVDDVARVIDLEWIATMLFPRSFGRSVTASHVTWHAGRTRWFMLIANRRQTTKSDIVSRLEDHRCTNITVQTIMAVPEFGAAERVGTPRAGTRRSRTSAPDGAGVVAR